MTDNNNRIFNDKYRENFLRVADPMSLNEYLKNMERLSRKGGKYLEIYNRDLSYLMQLNDNDFQEGGDLSFIFSKLGGNKMPIKELSINPTMSEQVCDTEAYIGKINNITKNSYCGLITQKTGKCDNTCRNRLLELETIKKTLNPDCKALNDNHKTAVQRFVDIILCCGDVYSTHEHEPDRTIYFKDLSKIISKNDAYLREAFAYLSKLLQNERNKLSEQFMKEYADLRGKKATTTRQVHKAAKDKLISDYIVNLGPDGFQKVYASKFVEKVINSYKKLMTPQAK